LELQKDINSSGSMGQNNFDTDLDDMLDELTRDLSLQNEKKKASTASSTQVQQLKANERPNSKTSIGSNRPGSNTKPNPFVKTPVKAKETTIDALEREMDEEISHIVPKAEVKTPVF